MSYGKEKKYFNSHLMLSSSVQRNYNDNNRKALFNDIIVVQVVPSIVPNNKASYGNTVRLTYFYFFPSK